MGSKKKSSHEEEERPRLRLDEIARSGRMRIHDAQGVAAEQDRVKSQSKKSLLKSLSKKAGKLKKAPKDDTDDEIRKLLESDDFGAPKSRIRFQPVEKPDDKKGHDIGKLWSDQEQIRKEEERLEHSYKEAKAQAKKLKKQLLKNQIGDGVATNLADKTGDLTAKISDVPLKFTKLLRGKKTPDLSAAEVPRRLGAASKTTGPTRAATSARQGVKRVMASKKVITGALSVIVLFGIIKAFSGSDSKKPADDQGTLGAQVSSSQLPVETPAFSLIFPDGKSDKDYKVVRVSPDGNAPAYAYADSINGQQVKLTQQELPDRLKTDSATELEKIAKDFQATNVIQVDENKIYHGINEKTHVQSLIFIKNKRLVFIAAPSKMDDSIWAAYYLSLR